MRWQSARRKPYEVLSFLFPMIELALKVRIVLGSGFVK
jgi:hypothetical protein